MKYFEFIKMHGLGNDFVIIENSTNLAEIKKKLERAYNEEDWNIVEDLIDVLDTVITIGEDSQMEWEDDDDEID